MHASEKVFYIKDILFVFFLTFLPQVDYSSSKGIVHILTFVGFSLCLVPVSYYLPVEEHCYRIFIVMVKKK